jgi:hypothetical protein
VSLADYLQREVQRSLDRVRLLSTYITSTDEQGREHRFPVPPVRTLADYRQAAKALRKVAFTETQRAAARQLEDVEQEPPERSNPSKHYCAAEAYFLMELFSGEAKPSTYSEGAFRTIAVLICEAVSGEAQVDLERACETVLHSRRRFQHRFG